MTLHLEDLTKEAQFYEQPLTEKQQAIVAAAEKLFGRQGYTHAPTAEIAREAGVTERTLFKHFASKDLLLKRVLFPVLLKLLKPLREPAVDVEDLFLRLFSERREFFDENGGKLRLILSELLKDPALRSQFASLWKAEVFEEVVAEAERLQQEGRIREDIDLPAFVRLMMTVIDGYWLSRSLFAADEISDERKDVERMLEILLRGVTAREANQSGAV